MSGSAFGADGHAETAGDRHGAKLSPAPQRTQPRLRKDQGDARGERRNRAPVKPGNRPLSGRGCRSTLAKMEYRLQDQGISGHADIGTLLNRYAHPQDNKIKELSKSMHNILKLD